MLKHCLIAVCCVAAFGCRQARERPLPAPVYDRDIADLLEAHCSRCHAGQDAGAAFRTDNYLSVLACPEGELAAAAKEDAGTGAPLLRALEREDHRQLLDGAQAARLRAWLQAGAPLRERTVHAPGILSPRSADWHGKLASRDHFGPITRADHPDVCGRCHAGAPVTPARVTHNALAAPACTSCHQEPQGVLACGTCHGDGARRAEPPRDACLFPSTQAGAHRAHLDSTRLTAQPLRCATCHGELPTALGGSHGDGKLDIVFDAAQAGPDASYDAATGQCNVRCHNRGGARAQPRFSETGPLECGDCHRTPPQDHYAGSCDRCHKSLDATGSKLLDVRAHIDGQSGPGDGPGVCVSCHGSGDDPSPLSRSHQLHHDTLLTRAIACAECHPLPERVASEGHLDRGVVTPADVQLGARAGARGRSPSYDAHSCSDIACHGAGLPEMLEPHWTWDAPTRRDPCSGCHSIPPTAQHTTDTYCASLVCHGTEISADSDLPSITVTGRSQHIDGDYDTAQP